MFQHTGPLQQKHENTLAMYPDENSEPCLHILEQPKARGFRFRYSCEGPSHGGIPGSSSDKNKKTYPAVQILNYTGYARIVVQLVTNEENPRLHPHSLVGKQCQNGICTVQCGPKDVTATFPNLGIQHVTKKNVAKILEQRYIAAEMQLGSLHEGLSEDVRSAIKAEDRKRIEAKAQSEAKSIDLSVVRLMFIAYLPDANGSFTLMLKPVVSDAIFDSKSPNAATLKICRMDKTNGAASGMDEVYLLCDKVQKDDIQVRFYEEDSDGEEVWDAYGDFSPTDVHRQFAIVFRTPRYRDVNIQNPVNVLVQLRRRSDGEVSEPRTFTYMPLKEDPEGIQCKKRKVNSHFNDNVAGHTNGGIQGNVGGTTRYMSSGGFVFQTNGSGNSHKMKQIAKYGPAPKGPDPQSMPVDPTTLMQRFMPLKQEPTTPPAMTNGNVLSPMVSPCIPPVMNGNAQSPASSYTSPHGSPNGGLSPQGYTYQHTAAQVTAVHLQGQARSPAYSDHNSLPMMTASEQSMMPEMIPGLQIPNPASLESVISQQQQFVQSSQVPAQTVQAPVNVQAQYIIMPTTDNDLYFDPSSVNNQTAETYAIEEVIADPANQDALDRLVVMLTQGATEPTQTMTCTGTAGHQGEVMNIFMNATNNPQLVQTDCVVEQPSAEDSDCCDREDLALGMQDDVEHSEDTEEKAICHESRLESHSCSLSKTVKATIAQTEQGSKPDPTNELQQATNTMSSREELLNEKTIDSHDGYSVMDITARTALSLQDFAVTGDVKMLLDTQGHLTDVQNADGDTCLHVAVIHEQSNSLLDLVQLIQTIPGSSEILNRYNYSQLTPLHIAIYCQNLEFVKYLVHAGADTVLVDSKGNTAIHLACITAQPNILHYLLTKTPDNQHTACNYEGMTALHLLAKIESESARECIGVLYHHGFDMDAIEMKSGRTVLHLAVEENNISVVGYLISECSVDLDAATFDGVTPLHIAAARDFIQTAALLVTCGADTDAEYSLDPDSTPVSLAASEQMVDILQRKTQFSAHKYVAEDEDICSMDPLVKMQLCYMLDQTSNGKDWQALAKQLDLETLIPVVESNRSPTETLLENYACRDGTVTSLKAALIEMECEDAVELLARASDLLITFPARNHLKYDDVDYLDSAIGSMTLSEQDASLMGC